MDHEKENANYYSRIGYIFGVISRDNGKEHGNNCSRIGYMLGLDGDDGKENGNYYIARLSQSVLNMTMH